MQMLRAGLPLLALLAVGAAGCATTGQQTLFDGSQVVHPEALFDVASRSAKLRQYNGGTGMRNGERICVRERDLVNVDALVGPSLAAVKGGGDSNKAARDFARAVNLSAYYILLTNDQNRAADDIAALRRHAETNAWLVAQPS